ncbi:MAG: hypothetical protein ACFE9S_06005 [Candidatus Hermodarchaeota archaeon]
MNFNEDPEGTLFGFRINNTGTVILSFISLMFCLNYITTLYINIRTLLSLFIFYSIPDILAYHLDSLVRYMILTLIPLILTSFLITIIVLCARIQMSNRIESSIVRWFFFRLTRVSLGILFLLSIIFIIIESNSVYNNLYYLWNFSHSLEIVSMYSFFLTTDFISITILIYTIIVCVRNKGRFI